MSNSANPNRLDFSVEAIPYFVKSLIAGLSVLVYVPAAEQVTKLLQYVTSHLRFPDGTTVSYTAGADSLKQPLLPLTILIWAQILLGIMISNQIVELGLSLAFALAIGYVTFGLTRTIIANLVTSTGSHLNFSGTMEEYLKWQLAFTACSVGPALLGFLLPQSGFLATLAAVGLALLPLVFIVFVMIAYSKWVASKISGGNRLASFEVEPVEMLAMFFGFILFCIPIVTIPWAMAWYVKWLMGRYSLPPRSAMAADGYAV